MAYRRGRFFALAATLSLAALVATAATASPAIAAPPGDKGKPTATAADSVTVSGASIEAAGSDYAVIGDLSNSSKSAVTISSASADAGTAELHDGTGVVAELTVPRRSTLTLAVDGEHIRLSNLPETLPADVTITLTFSDTSTLEFTAPMPATPPPPPPAPVADSITVSAASIEAAGSDYAVLADIENSSATAATISSASADAGTAALHDSTGAVTELTVAGGSTLTLAPDGEHIRLSNLPETLPADVTITLTFSDTSTLEFTAPMPATPPPPPPAPVADSITVTSASIEAAGSDYAVLADIENSSATAATISSASADAGTAALHDSTGAVTELTVAGGSTLTLTVDGEHIRLSNLPETLPADVTITLTFSDTSTLEFTAPMPATPPPPPPAPSVSVMAAVGDSITVAYDAAGYGSYPQYSWATGSSTTVDSHLLRLQDTLQSSVTATNLAVVGASSADLASQITSAVSARADYLTIEIGANDACTSTVAEMTSVADYDQRIRAALQTFHTARPDAEIFVASIPNLYQMWNVSKGKFAARFTWSIAGICQSMLANPTSTSQADEDRRLSVQQRVDDYNAALAAACTATVNCTFDGYEVADYVFSSKDVSTSDYFHPSVEGQRVLAEITWPLSPFASGG